MESDDLALGYLARRLCRRDVGMSRIALEDRLSPQRVLRWHPSLVSNDVPCRQKPNNFTQKICYNHL